VLQQAVLQVLMPHYESKFSVNSYGFRPDKNARQAVGKALEHIHEGFTFIVDIDLKTVNRQQKVDQFSKKIRACFQ
jgi:retron-type reverse transcriptase